MGNGCFTFSRQVAQHIKVTYVIYCNQQIFQAIADVPEKSRFIFFEPQKTVRSQCLQKPLNGTHPEIMNKFIAAVSRIHKFIVKIYLLVSFFIFKSNVRVADQRTQIVKKTSLTPRS